MNMRESLFRGKRIDNGEWVEGSLLIDGEAHKPKKEENLSFSKHYIVPETDRDNIKTRFNDGAFYLNTIAYHVIPETVGQFTGLTDKNGKKIFEGDVVQYFGTYPLEVFIENGHAKFRFYDTYSKRQYEEPFFGHDEEYGECEVIGNIHDNPELLNGGQENGC